jgi:hypothetical protein
MSVFRVKLQNTAQGLLDKSYATGTGVQQTTSLQRTAYIMGPHKVNRKLVDGETFTDCNYYKKFCAYDATTNPWGCSAADAILALVTDDGSVYSDVEGENTYIKVYTLSCANGTTFDDDGNSADIAGDTGGSYANFCQIQVSGLTGTLLVRLNGNTVDGTFSMAASETQTFNPGDIQITKIEIDNSVSGASGTAVVEIICGVKSVANS